MSIIKKSFPFVYINYFGVGVYITKTIDNIQTSVSLVVAQIPFIKNNASITTSINLTVS